MRGILLALSLVLLPALAEGQECTFSIDNPTLRFGPGGTEFWFRVNAGAACGSFVRQVSTTAGWLTTPAVTAIPANTSVVLKLAVAANTTAVTRSASLLFDGQPVVAVTQGTTSCVTGVTPASGTFPVAGGQLGFAVQTATPDCVWDVTGFPPPPFFVSGFGWAYVYHLNSQGIGGRPTVFQEIGARGFAVDAQSNVTSAQSRSVTLDVGGAFPVTLTQAGATCTFTFTPSTITIPANGGSGSATLTGAGSDCSYATLVSSGPVTVTAGQSGVAPAMVTVSMPANTTLANRTGIVVAGDATLAVRQSASPVTIDVTSIIAGAARSTDGAVRVTRPEPVRIINDEDPAASWTAAASQPWVVLAPASGQGSSTLHVSVDPALVAALPAGSSTATIDIVSPIAPQSPRRIQVWLWLNAGAPGERPLGVVDTPAQGATGLSGAVPITGWAGDRVGISAIRIYRNSVAGEPQGLIYVGDALRVFGARPDVVPFLASFPEARLGGWGYMLLSNVLPNGGNGTFTFSAYAEDLDGNNTLIGTRTVTFDNANATKPFGTIDVPAQGQTVSGTIVNRGWVLTPSDKSIPPDGSTIKVYIDGVLLGPVATYNHARPDVLQYFPGLNNSSGPEARLAIDTTTLSDGVHTIAWGVIDDAGAAEGIGSRFFTVQNGSSSLVWAPEEISRSAKMVTSLPVLQTDVWSRAGVDETGWATRVDVDAKGRRTLRAAQGQRIEVFLDPTLAAPCGTYEGHLLNGEVAGPLPVGASLDARHGIFRWQPTAAFGGSFDFVFVQRGCDAMERRMSLKIVLGAR